MTIPDPPLDLGRLDAHDWCLFMEGYECGHAHGVTRGRQLEHDEVARIQRHAVRNVHAAAKLPPRDADADRARRARIDARFGGDAA